MTDSIFLDYDQAGLDAQLNLRERHKDFPEHFARYRETSAQARAAIGGRLDLAYGRSAGQKLDLFLPGDGRPPLVVFIHGGYWQWLDKSDFSYLAPAYLEAGIGFASLNYDLAPEVSVGEIVRQVRAGLAWLHSNAADLGFDRTRMVVAGHSAGGHLAAMALSTVWPEGLPADMVKGACSVSGVYDLEPLRLSYHQPALKLDPESARALSPLQALPGRAGPLILAVGAQETDEFLRQQAAFGDAWQGAGHQLQVVDLPGHHHFTAVDALGQADHALFRVVAALARGDL